MLLPIKWNYLLFCSSLSPIGGRKSAKAVRSFVVSVMTGVLCGLWSGSLNKSVIAALSSGRMYSFLAQSITWSNSICQSMWGSFSGSVVKLWSGVEKQWWRSMVCCGILAKPPLLLLILDLFSCPVGSFAVSLLPPILSSAPPNPSQPAFYTSHHQHWHCQAM